jgi:hypothetical protein
VVFGPYATPSKGFRFHRFLVRDLEVEGSNPCALAIFMVDVALSPHFSSFFLFVSIFSALRRCSELLNTEVRGSKLHVS